MKLIYLILIVLLLFSCAHKHKGEQSTSLLSNFVSITDNEDKGVKEVLDFYGGYCEYSIGENFSTDSGKKKYFELKLTKSEVANKFANLHEFTASNMAYIFYKDLKSEQKNYSEIRSVLILNGNDKYEARYSADQLELATKKLKVFDKVFESIKTKNYDTLKTIFSDGAYTDSAKNQMINNLKKIDLQYGNVKSLLVYGFRFETQNNFNVLDILGVFIRDKENNPVSIKVDLKPTEDKIHFLDYTFPQN